MSNTLSKILALWLLLAPVFAQAQAVSLGIPNPAQQRAVVQGGGAVSGGPTVGYILDQLSSYPAVAFSVRQMTAGPYLPSYDMTVRRSSDNSQTNIGFSGGMENVAQLASFYAGTNAYLVTWKDQGSLGSSADATQSTAANQPQVCASGVVENIGGIPAVYFAGSQYLKSSSVQVVNPTNGTVTVSAVAYASTTTQQTVIDHTGNSRLWALGYGMGSTSNGYFQYYYNTSGSASASGTLTFPRLIKGIFVPDTGSFYENGALASTGSGVTVVTTGTSPITLGTKASPSLYLTGYIQEVYAEGVVQSASDAFIYDLNAASFFGITGVTQ